MANMGWFGAALGALALIGLKEPKRQVKVVKREISFFGGLKELFAKRTTALISLGSALKYTLPFYYFPYYFLRKFPNYSD